jgi:hypothetical protein
MFCSKVTSCLFFLLFLLKKKNRCVIETELRCPFRDLVRARANNLIKTIAQHGKIWEEKEAAKYCNAWYGRELGNVTRIGAVWDALKMLPCPLEESAIRNVSCFQIETSNVLPTHPLAKFCYSSYPLQLNIGLTVSTQCCYGADLRLLVLGSRGAGTVDFSAKLSKHEDSDADHFQHDLFPSLACCALSDNCVKYSAVRPASLVPESDAEVRESCRVMQEVYHWEPYKLVPPPYARKEAEDAWAKLDLTSTSLVPTSKVAELLAQAQQVRKRIQDGVDAYPETTAHATTHKSTTEAHEETTAHKPATTKKPQHTTEAEDTTHRPATTKKTTEEPTTEESASTKSPSEETTSAHTRVPSKKPVKKSGQSDSEIDNAIETVLKAQVGNKKGKGKDLDRDVENELNAVVAGEEQKDNKKNGENEGKEKTINEKKKTGVEKHKD